jgi:phosphate-selective porin OprO and OprP
MPPPCRTRQPIRQIRGHGPDSVSEYRTAFARQSYAWPVLLAAPLCAFTLLLTMCVGVRASSAEPQTATQTSVPAPTQTSVPAPTETAAPAPTETAAPAPTQTTDGSVAATAQSGEEPTQTDSARKSKGKNHKAKTKTDGAEPSSGESVKAPKDKKDGAENNGDDGVKAPKHPSWKPARGVRLEFKGRIESETRPTSPPASLDQGVVEWQDRRLGVEGSVSKRFTFEISRELGKDFEESHDLSEKSAWKDAYVSARLSKAFAVDAGRFKLPFGREELRGETNLDFAYRSFAARVLSPGRDVGIMAHGRLLNRRAEYQVGYFARDGENSRTSQTVGGRDAVAARFVVSPFRGVADRLVAPLEIGVSVETSHLDNRLGIRGRTVLGDGIFFDRLYMNGLRRRVGFDAGWESGPFSLSSEYVSVSEERRGMGFDGANLPGVDARAWSIAGTWALTGERKHGRVEPTHDLLRNGYGAIELAVRTEALGFDMASAPDTLVGYPTASTLLANADHATTVGVNWYMNHYVKLEADVVLESIDDPARSPSPSTGGRFISTVLFLQFHF